MGEKWDLVGICIGLAWDFETTSFNVNFTKFLDRILLIIMQLEERRRCDT